MTTSSDKEIVMPANLPQGFGRISLRLKRASRYAKRWIPVFTGMTEVGMPVRVDNLDTL